MEFRSSLRVLQPRHDVVAVEQHHEMLCQVGQRVDHQLGFGEQHGSSLCDAEQCPNDRHVLVREIPRLCVFIESATSDDLGHRSANHRAAQFLLQQFDGV